MHRQNLRKQRSLPKFAGFCRAFFLGASIAANKVSGVRAGLIHDVFSAHQGVEDDDMNICGLGGKVIGSALAWELIETFLTAHFSNEERHIRRLAKVQALGKQYAAS